MLTVSGVMNRHASAFIADTMNMIQKVKRHPRRDWDTHPPTIGPSTMYSVFLARCKSEARMTVERTRTHPWSRSV